MQRFWKEGLILLTVMVLSIVFVRRFTKGDTLEDYAMRQGVPVVNNDTEERFSVSIKPDTAEPSPVSSNAADTGITQELPLEGAQGPGNPGSASANTADTGVNQKLPLEGKLSAELTDEVESEPSPVSSPYTISEIPDDIFARMQGKSFPDHCTVPREDLRYLTVPYVDFNGATQTGELVCNKAIAQDLAEIFTALYEAGYPIQSIRLIDDYNADDDVSVAANNTSCFCYRVVDGTTKLSNHARGLAIDINPLYNPYVKFQADGTPYTKLPVCVPYIDRTDRIINPYRIDTDDLCYQLFVQHGFRWGGAWRNSRDYQHFEKVN